MILFFIKTNNYQAQLFKNMMYSYYKEYGKKAAS